MLCQLKNKFEVKFGVQESSKYSIFGICTLYPWSKQRIHTKGSKTPCTTISANGSLSSPAEHGHGGHLHGHGINPSGGTASHLREFFTVLALSLHAVFEGLAVGLEETTAGVWTLFAAIASHKFVISFCMGVELVSVGGCRELTEWVRVGGYSSQ